MIDCLKPYSVTTVQSLPEWESILQEIQKIGIFGLNLSSTGSDPLSQEIKSVSFALPNGPCNSSIYAGDTSDRPELKEGILTGLAGLLEDGAIKKVLYDSKSVLSSIRAKADRKLQFCNIFDLVLASRICWSGYYYLIPSGNSSNPWTKRLPDHSLASLAERHLGLILDKDGSPAKEAAALLPLHDILAELLAKNDLQRVADIEFRAASALAEMEISGIGLDTSRAREIVAREEDEVFNLVGIMQDEAEEEGICHSHL